MKNKIIISSVALVVLALTLTGCSVQTQQNAQTYTVTKRDLTSTVTLSGVVAYDPEMSVIPSVSGKVLHLFVQVGDTVKTGDKIAEIDSTAAKNNYESVLINYKNAQLTYLISQASEKDLESSLAQAQSNLESVQASYEIAKLNASISQKTDNSALQIQQAEQQVNTAQVNLQDAESKLKLLQDTSDDSMSAQEIQIKNAQISLALAQLNLKILKESKTSEQNIISAEEQLKQARLNLDNAEKKLEQAASNPNTAEADLVTLQNQVIAAQSNVKLAELNLEKVKNPQPSTADQIQQSEYQVQQAELSLKNAIQTYKDQLQSAQEAVDQAKTNLAVAQSNLDFVKRSISTSSDSQAIKELQLKQAEISLNNAKASVESAKRQIETNKLKIEQAQYQTEQVNNNLQIALDALNDYTIRAPIDGTITQLSVSEGDTVSLNMPIAIIGNTKKFVITAYADEVDVVNLAARQSLSITFDQFPGNVLNGSIKSIGMEKVSTSQGVSAYEVTVQVPETNLNLRGGFSANLDIVTAKKENVIAVPISSITTLANGQSFVDLVGADGKIQRVEVKTGITGNTFTEIVSGLKEGGKILLISEGSTSTGSSSPNLGIPGMGR